MKSTYGHINCTQRLVFSDGVLEHFRLNRQTDGPEVGGQLFGTYEDDRICVKFATGPRTMDKKMRFLFTPSRRLERREIFAFFKKGLHYLGDWHTHPEIKPTPSQIDLDSMQECFTKSRHEHHAFIMVIVGNGSNDNHWLCVSLHDACQHLRLTPTP